VFRLTSRTAARSRAGGRRSPGFASPSAIARRISAGTVIAGTDQGVFWSTDGGDRWRRFTHLPPRTFDALAIDRSAGLLYAGANGGGIYELKLAR